MLLERKIVSLLCARAPLMSTVSSALPPKLPMGPLKSCWSLRSIIDGLSNGDEMNFRMVRAEFVATRCDIGLQDFLRTRHFV